MTTNMNEKQQVELLMSDLLSFAKVMLKSHQEFHPFAGKIDLNGEITQIGVDMGSNSIATDLDRFELLELSLVKATSNSDITAVGLVVNVSIERGGIKRDAVEIILEHRLGYAPEVFAVYELEALGVEPTIIEVFAQAGTPKRFFSH
jgi:hypothetical protein